MVKTRVKSILGISKKPSNQQNFANNGGLQQNQLNPYNGNGYPNQQNAYQSSGTPLINGNPNRNSNFRQNFASDNRQNYQGAQNGNQMFGQRNINFPDQKKQTQYEMGYQNQRSIPQVQNGDGIRNGNQRVDGQRDTNSQKPHEWKVGYPKNDGSNVIE